MNLPPLPTSHENCIAYVSGHPDTPLHDLIAPFKEYDSKLREIFAQHPDHPAIREPHVVPLYVGQEQDVKIRARNLEAESEAESQCYLMPLTASVRKTHGEPAIVQSLKEFQTNFQLFSESALVDMDWSNVVVAGSAVVTSLLPVPPKHGSSKRALREYYHQKLAPASDVDLFIYGLTEEQAIEKIKQIEQRIRDSILTETTTVRTKNAITVVSQYPTRHVQIVLRIYRSISEILTGFDVDCSCAAYDGNQVYVSPRALAAYMTQINTIDLTRRSPSYENRLSKYSRRGFEVYWPLLDRSRIDPTLFERSFGRTLGLARLLVLEKLPKNTDREAYVDQRRAERGRPRINRWATRKLKGNMKDKHEDEIAEWVKANDVSNYHTFTIPYGPKYNARNIERLLYVKDLLLNAEWNRPKERETALHRHPAFFGNAVDVIGDCCGYCPEPISPEDQELADEEAKTYVSGHIAFIEDDPGRQTIGSFHPITNDDWTEMAYVGNTTRLCQAIVDGDLDHVQDWLRQEGADPNRRDYTGRTPLQLAVTSSTLEIVQCLIDAGARITARLFDGKTALHLAAMSGRTEIVMALLFRSEANEQEEAEKEEKNADFRKASDETETMDMNKDTSADQPRSNDDIMESDASENEDDDIDILDDESEHVDATTENSTIKIDRKQTREHEHLPDDENQDEPDVYDINVLAWDTPVTALHLAIANGHTETVRTLVQDFGADVLLPIKLVNEHNKSPRAAILPLVLALHLEKNNAKEMSRLLLSLGASPAQADIDHVTALHYFAAHGSGLLKAMVLRDRPAAQRAIHHLSISGSQYNPEGKSALQTAILNKDVDGIEILLELGAKAQVDYSTFITSVKSRWDLTGTAENNQDLFRQNFQQPVMTAIESELPSIVSKLLDAGAEVNTLSTAAQRALIYGSSYRGGVSTLLDSVQERIVELSGFLETGKDHAINYRFPVDPKEPTPLKNDEEYLLTGPSDDYVSWTRSKQLQQAKIDYERDFKSYEEFKASKRETVGISERKSAVKSLLAEFQALEAQLLERGAKTFKELHPDLRLLEHQEYPRYEPPEPKPWSPSITFQVPDLTDERCNAYIDLFQACWNGDITTVKELTLLVWGDDQSQSPLKIAVKDTSNFSPFSIAVLRGHFDLAEAILEIAHAQYAPTQKTGQARHTIRPSTDEDQDEDDNEDIFKIYSEILDDKFTVEGIGAVQSQVRSTVTPLEMMLWPCPVFCFLEDDKVSDTTVASSPSFLDSSGNRWPRNSYARKLRRGHTVKQNNIPEMIKPANIFQLAIFIDDEDFLDFMLTMGEDYTTRKACNPANVDEAKPKIFRFNELDFQYAIRLGRIALLQHIIRRTGAGMPLDNLIKQSGVEVVKRPKYYQGLSVHGKKREDWANAGRDMNWKTQEEHHPPLLHAARLANLESVEWFLSDAAPRCYIEFANNHHDDARIQNLGNAKSGIEGSINKWLGLRSHLLIHCVIVHKTTEDSLGLLRHLCKAHPEAVEHRSATGLTPLHLAFSLHRVEMAKVLIAAGGDQTSRNNARDNIIHSTLYTVFNSNMEKNVTRLRELLGLVDSRLLPSLLKERTTQPPSAATPLSLWLFRHSMQQRAEERERFLQVILQFSKGEDLGIINAEGDTPVHMAVRYKANSLLRIMLECRPELLYRENAAGFTPYEMAEDRYLSQEVFHDPPSLVFSSKSRQGYYARHSSDILAREPKSFVEEASEDKGEDFKKGWQVCKEFAAKTQGTKRKLVKLVEANEVSKRLASQTDDNATIVSSGEAGSWGDSWGDEVVSWFDAGSRADD